MMDIELRDIRRVEVGEIETRRQRSGLRRRPRLWVTLHTAELDELKRRGRARKVSVAAQFRWAINQHDRETALQSLTGIDAETARPPRRPWA